MGEGVGPWSEAEGKLGDARTVALTARKKKRGEEGQGGVGGGKSSRKKSLFFFFFLLRSSLSSQVGFRVRVSEGASCLVFLMF